MSSAARDQPAPAAPIDRAAAVFKALADPIRIRVVAAIRDSDDATACFCDLAALFDMPQSSLSHHLKVLVGAGLLSRERRGTWSWYTLRPEPFALLQDVLRPGELLTRSPECDPDDDRINVSAAAS